MFLKNFFSRTIIFLALHCHTSTSRISRFRVQDYDIAAETDEPTKKAPGRPALFDFSPRICQTNGQKSAQRGRIFEEIKRGVVSERRRPVFGRDAVDCACFKTNRIDRKTGDNPARHLPEPKLQRGTTRVCLRPLLSRLKVLSDYRTCPENAI